MINIRTTWVMPPSPKMDKFETNSSSSSEVALSTNLYDVHEKWFMKHIDSVRFGLLKFEIHEPYADAWREFVFVLIANYEMRPLGYGDPIHEEVPDANNYLSTHRTVKLTEAGRMALCKHGVPSMLVADMKRFFGQNGLDMIYGWDPINGGGPLVVRNMVNLEPAKNKLPLFDIVPVHL